MTREILKLAGGSLALALYLAGILGFVLFIAAIMGV